MRGPGGLHLSTGFQLFLFNRSVRDKEWTGFSVWMFYIDSYASMCFQDLTYCLFRDHGHFTLVFLEPSYTMSELWPLMLVTQHIMLQSLNLFPFDIKHNTMHMRCECLLQNHSWWIIVIVSIIFLCIELLQHNLMTRFICSPQESVMHTVLTQTTEKSAVTHGCLSSCTHQCGLTNKMHWADGSGSNISLPMWINGHRLETQTPFYLGW